MLYGFNQKRRPCDAVRIRYACHVSIANLTSEASGQAKLLEPVIDDGQWAWAWACMRLVSFLRHWHQSDTRR